MKLELLILAVAAGVASCSQGGTQKRTSEVTLSLDHQISFIAGRAQFPERFPIKQAPYTRQATLIMQKDGTWRVAEPGVPTTPPYDYNLSALGELLIFQPRSNRSTQTYVGYYDLDGDTYFYTKRDLDYNPPNQSVLAFYCGVAEPDATPDLENAWSVFGTTLIFADPKSTPNNDLVGRAFAGQWKIADVSNVLTIQNGEWRDSGGVKVTVDGEATIDSTGYSELDLDLTRGSTNMTRIYKGGIGKNVGVFTDTVVTDGSVGTLFLVRQIGAKADKSKVVGQWRAGVFTIFNDKDRPGTDVAFGLLEMNDDDSFKITITGANQKPFVYTGTWSIGDFGQLTLEEKGRNQTWQAAVSPDYRNIIIADTTTDRVEPEVGFFFCMRKIEPKK